VHALRKRILADQNARPDRREQFILAQHPSGPGGEDQQQVEGLAPQRYHPAFLPEFHTKWVELIRPEREPGTCWRSPTVRQGRHEPSLNQISG